MNETNKCAHSTAHNLTYLLVGGGIGAGLALLFAPKSGGEMRSSIADATRKGYEATALTASDLKVKSTELVEAVKEKAAGLLDSASNKANTGIHVVEEVINKTSQALSDGQDHLQKESRDDIKSVNRRSSSSIV